MIQHAAHWKVTPSATTDPIYDQVASGAAQASALLERAEGLIERRAALMAKSRQTSWDGPGLLLVIDEAQELMADPVYGERIKTSVEQLLREGQRLGVDLTTAPSDNEKPRLVLQTPVAGLGDQTT